MSVRRETLAEAHGIKPEQVNCRDCEFAEKWVGDCYKCRFWDRMVGGDDFCSFFTNEEKT